ncbi:MAG: hypothetical protein AAF787_01765 [Chloroflexota bacterium]
MCVRLCGDVFRRVWVWVGGAVVVFGGVAAVCCGHGVPCPYRVFVGFVGEGAAS